MKKGDQVMLATAALLGVAAWMILRPRETQAIPRPGDYISLPGGVYGPTQPAPAPIPSTGPEPEGPGIFETAGAWLRELVTPEIVQSAYRSNRQWRALLQPEFRRWENEFGLPDGLLEAIAERESGFRDAVITCVTLGKVGEKGLMQIWPKYHPDKGCSPLWSIEYAAGFFREQFDRYQNWPMAIMAWNWGSGNMEKFGTAAVPQKTKDYIAFIDSKVDLA